MFFGKHDDDHYLGKLIAQKPGNLSQRRLFCFSLSLRVRLEKRGEQQGGGGKEGTGGRSCKKHILNDLGFRGTRHFSEPEFY